MNEAQKVRVNSGEVSEPGEVTLHMFLRCIFST